MMLYQLGHITEIRYDGHLYPIAAKGIAHGIGRVVRDGERIDFDIANREVFPRMNVLDALHLLHGAFGINFQNFRMRGLGKVRRTVKEASQLRDATGMVGVLVGNQDRVDALGSLPAQRFQAAQQFLLSKSRVNKESGVLCLEQRAVARAAGCQDGDAERNSCSLRATPARTLLARRCREGSWQNCWRASIKTGAIAYFFGERARAATSPAGWQRITSPLVSSTERAQPS